MVLGDVVCIFRVFAKTRTGAAASWYDANSRKSFQKHEKRKKYKYIWVFAMETHAFWWFSLYFSCFSISKNTTKSNKITNKHVFWPQNLKLVRIFCVFRVFGKTFYYLRRISWRRPPPSSPDRRQDSLTDSPPGSPDRRPPGGGQTRSPPDSPDRARVYPTT